MQNISILTKSSNKAANRLGEYLEKDFAVFYYRDSKSFLSALDRFSFDIVICDYKFKLLDGFHFIDKVKQRQFVRPLLFVTFSDNPLPFEDRHRCFFPLPHLAKQQDTKVLGEQVQTAIAKFNKYIQSQSNCFGYQYVYRVNGVTIKFTPSERKIIPLLAEGLTTKEIAKRAHIDHKTVSSHIEHMFRKTGFRNRTQFAVAVLKNQSLF